MKLQTFFSIDRIVHNFIFYFRVWTGGVYMYLSKQLADHAHDMVVSSYSLTDNDEVWKGPSKCSVYEWWFLVVLNSFMLVLRSSHDRHSHWWSGIRRSCPPDSETWVALVLVLSFHYTQWLRFKAYIKLVVMFTTVLILISQPELQSTQ